MPEMTPPFTSPSMTRGWVALTLNVGATTTDELIIPHGVLLALELPSNLTATALYLDQRREMDGPWSRIQVDGADLTIPVVAGKTARLDPSDTIGFVRLRVVAGTAQATTPATIYALVGGY